MDRPPRPHNLDTGTRTLRSSSFSSDVVSASAKSIPSAIPRVTPSPAYISQEAASTLVSAECDRSILVSPPALGLVNEFLDHVLFSILATARSVSLVALKTAVPNVLKPRLGKAALKVAEDELREYLEDDEEVELHAAKQTIDSRLEFDTELSFKLARLRCMVYTRLGDLEDEDEEEWLEREHLPEQTETARKLLHAEVDMGPASAILLTSVIEFLGEQALYSAAQYALKKHILTATPAIDDVYAGNATLTPKTDEIVIDGKDMNHVGRDSQLSRLWRSWRRNTRESTSRPLSPESMSSPRNFSPLHSRNGSHVRQVGSISEGPTKLQVPISPSQIPLPMRHNDVDEIEVPGLAPAYSDGEAADDPPGVPGRSQQRPRSMVVIPGAFPSTGAEHDDNDDDDDQPEVPDRSPLRPSYSRTRSMSSPAPMKGPFNAASSRAPAEPEVTTHQPTEEFSQSEADGSEEFHDVPAPEIDAVLPGLNSYDHVPKPVVDTSFPPSEAGPEIHTAQSAESDNSVTRRPRKSSGGPGSPSKRAGMVGGVLESAIGAAGAAGAGAVAAATTDERNVEREAPKPVHVTAPKRTVAEEMLGPSASSVMPPKDATTGASITNISDFDTMHIPLQMPPNQHERPVSNYQNPQQQSGSQSSLAQEGQASSRSSGQLSRKALAPVQTTLPEAARDLSSQADLNPHRRPQETYRPIADRPDTIATTSFLLADGTERDDSPVSPLAASPLSDASRPFPDAYYAGWQAGPPIHQTALHSNPVKHGHSESKTSVYSHNSKSSSSSTRYQGSSQDAHAAGPIVHDTRALQMNQVGVSRGGRQESSNSSMNRQALKGRAFKANDEPIDETKKKNFEVLIQSNETLHYTLTPTTIMKEQDAPATHRRTETQDMADFIRNTAPPGVDPTTAARPVHQRGSRQAASTSVDVTPQRSKVIPSSHKYSPSQGPQRTTNPLGQPRDARPETTSLMRDLADYARSTGPADESQMPRPLGGRASMLPPAQRDSTGAPTKTGRARNKLQARDARPSRNDDNADFIDFIREGPPRAPGDHGADRRGPPLRSATDSEDVNSVATKGGSRASTYTDASRNAVSNDPSMNSRTALLQNKGATNGSPSQPPRAAILQQQLASRQSRPAPEDDGMPKRTRRRVKDPYAIEDSDDEDFYGEPQRPTNEESLIDFLRNTAPPPGMQPQPIMTSQTAAARSVQSGAQPSIARENSPHLAHSGKQRDSHKPRAAHLDQVRPKPRYEAREPEGRRTGTSDLADFLNSSGPPPAAQSNPQPFILSSVYSGDKSLPSTPKSPPREDPGMFRKFTKRNKAK